MLRPRMYTGVLLIVLSINTYADVFFLIYFFTLKFFFASNVIQMQSVKKPAAKTLC